MGMVIGVVALTDKEVKILQSPYSDVKEVIKIKRKIRLQGR